MNTLVVNLIVSNVQCFNGLIIHFICNFLNVFTADKSSEESVTDSDADDIAEINIASEGRMCVNDWVAAAIDHVNGKRVSIFYVRVTDVDVAEKEVTVSFLTINCYKLFLWPEKADYSVVSMLHIIRIAEPETVAQSSSQNGVLRVADGDIACALHHFM